MPREMQSEVYFSHQDIFCNAQKRFVSLMAVLFDDAVSLLKYRYNHEDTQNT